MTDLVGRREELGWLRELLSGARGSLVLITGEAGIGKTSLALAAARARPAEYLVSYRGVRSLVPGFGLRSFVEMATGGIDPLIWGGEEIGRAALYRAVTSVAVDRSPFTLVLDDVHWADELTLGWLSACEAVLESGSSIVATARPYSGGSTTIASSVSTIASLGYVRSIELGPLTETEVAELALREGLPKRRGVTSALYEGCVGNPLVARELCLRYRTFGSFSATRSAPSASSFSTGLKQVTREQLAEVSPGARRLAETAALAPQPVDESLLRHATSSSETAFLEHVGELVAVGMCELDRREQIMAFRHELKRQFVEDSLSLFDKRRLHLDIARSLMNAPGASATQIARQLVEAAQRQEARAWLERAAQEAFDNNDGEQGLALLTEELEYVDPSDSAALVRLGEMTVGAARLASDPDRGLIIVDRALAAAAQDPYARGHLLLGRARLVSYKDDYDARFELLTEAAECLEGTDLRGQAEAFTELAFPAGRHIHLEERLAAGRKGTKLARDTGDVFTESSCLANLGVVQFYLGDPGFSRTVDSALRLLDSGDATHRIALARQLSNRAQFYLCYGDTQRVHESVDRGLSQSRDSLWPGVLQLLKGLAHWREGEWSEAHDLLREACSVGTLTVFHLGRLAVAIIEFEHGDDTAWQQVDASTAELIRNEEDQWIGLACALRLSVRVARREPNPTRDIQPHMRATLDVGMRVGWDELLPVLASVSRSSFDRTVEIMGETAPFGPRAAANVALAKGIRAGQDPGGDALPALTEAVSRFEDLRDPYALARSLEALARATTIRREARDALGRAAEAYAGIGAYRSLTRVVRQARRRGIRIGQPRPPIGRSPGLTPREHEVAALAARGYTGGEIASELSIAPATARKHLEHVIMKLGVRRKSDLVRVFSAGDM